MRVSDLPQVEITESGLVLPPDHRRLTGDGWRVQWLLDGAKWVGSAADCSRRLVGAIFYDPETWLILATGYNGRAAGLPGCLTAGGCPRGRMTYEQVGERTPYLTGEAGECDAIHAEDNGLRRARDNGVDVTGSHVAITDEPCPGCYALLRHYRVARAIWPGGFKDLPA